MRILLLISLFILSSVPAMAGPVIDMTGTRLIRIEGQVGPDIMASAIKMDELSSASKEPINIVINSPGGSVFAGIQMVEAIHIAQNRGVKVRCAVSTMAASMAFIILSECDERYAFSNSLLLFHPASVGIMFGVLRAEQARAIAEDLEAINDDMSDLMKAAMGVNDFFQEQWYRYHFNKETLWTAKRLAKEAPNEKFLAIISDIRLDKGLFSTTNDSGGAEAVNQFLQERGAL